jgi:Glycosyl hydrolases family 35
MRGNRVLRYIYMMPILATATAFARAEPTLAGEAVGVQFSQPSRIRYNNRSLIIDGKPVFIFSGAMHYFRCPHELWNDRLQKLKDAGLNCVETYLAWNLHEPDEPANPSDFSKLRDMEQISEFIQTARNLGLYVIIRPGPYICAEVDRGGLPAWLMKYRPDGVRQGQFLRGNSPVMLEWDRHWFTAAARVVKPYLITNVPKGSTGVILWQLENEYDWNFADLTPGMRTDVLNALAHASLDNGIDVPLFTCETMDKAFRADPFLRSHVFNTTNKYPGFDVQPLIKSIEDVAEYQPEAFRGVTELQGGWFSQVGGKLSEAQGHNAAQIRQITLTAIERGCTSINYYMFYGGSNFGQCAARTLTQTYDYNAPLREWGGEGDRYFAVKAIGQMLKEHGDQLIHSDPVPLTIEGDHPDVSVYLRRSEDGSQFFFVRNSKQNESRSGVVKVRPKEGSEQSLSYRLGNFEANVLYLPAGTGQLAGGKWLLKPIERPEAIQSVAETVPVRVASIAPEEPASDWRAVPKLGHLDSAGVFDQRYVHYRVKFDLSAGDLKSASVLLVRSDGGGETLAARVNGTEVIGSKDGHISLANVAHAGDNTAEILFENLGCPNFGPVIEERQGITQVAFVPQTERDLSVKSDDDAVERPLNDLEVSSDTVVGNSIAADQHRRLLVHYTLEFQIPRDRVTTSVPWKLHLDADANAFVTLNGHLLGRYWAAGPQHDIWLPECWLNFGPDAKNVVELQARPTVDAPVGKIIKEAQVRPYVQ